MVLSLWVAVVSCALAAKPVPPPVLAKVKPHPAILYSVVGNSIYVPAAAIYRNDERREQRAEKPTPQPDGDTYQSIPEPLKQRVLKTSGLMSGSALRLFSYEKGATTSVATQSLSVVGAQMGESTGEATNFIVRSKEGFTCHDCVAVVADQSLFADRKFEPAELSEAPADVSPAALGLKAKKGEQVVLGYLKLDSGEELVVARTYAFSATAQCGEPAYTFASRGFVRHAGIWSSFELNDLYGFVGPDEFKGNEVGGKRGREPIQRGVSATGGQVFRIGDTFLFIEKGSVSSAHVRSPEAGACGC